MCLAESWDATPLPQWFSSQLMIKGICTVNIKLGFRTDFLCNLIILTKFKILQKKKIKKVHYFEEIRHFFRIVVIIKLKMCAKFHPKILKSTVVGIRQSFEFFRQITWFPGNKALSKCTYRICIT